MFQIHDTSSTDDPPWFPQLRGRTSPLCARPPAPWSRFTRCSPSGGVPAGSTGPTNSATRSLTALLEAARWAPSAQNSQPWRFLVTRRGDQDHGRLFAALAPGNQAWAGAASALVLVAARTAADDGSPQPWALYDTGQAVAALVTQAQADGLAVHQMGGFDSAAVRAALGLGDTLTPVVILAIGRSDSTASLPGPLAARETAPRTRHPVSDLLLPARTAPQLQAA